MSTELTWIAELKDITFSFALLLLIALFTKGVAKFARFTFDTYMKWRKEEQGMKDKRAEAYQKNSEALVVQISEVVRTNQEGTRVVLESLSKGAEKAQTRHESIMTCIGGLLRDTSKQGIERR